MSKFAKFQQVKELKSRMDWEQKQIDWKPSITTYKVVSSFSLSVLVNMEDLEWEE